MRDDDACPFTPEHWITAWTPDQKDQAGFADLTSLRGTLLRARTTSISSHNRAPRPGWLVVHRPSSGMLGWVSMSPGKPHTRDPIQDIAAALTKGQDLPARMQPFEDFLLDQGHLGGTWRYWKQEHALIDRGRHIRVPLADALQPDIDAIFPLSRFCKDTGSWELLSGLGAIQFSLPATRHAVLERSARLQQA